MSDAGSTCLTPDQACAFVGHECGAARRVAIEVHLDACSGCRMFVSELARRVQRGSGRAVDRDPEPGDRVGRYTLAEPIAAGASGIVFRALDSELHREVAVKVFHRSLEQASLDPRHQRRLVAEARTAAQVNHPNVVAVLDVGVQGGLAYLAMEYVEGPTLAAWLHTSSRSTGAVLERFIAAGRGLAAVHAAGYIHGDFKPQNVLCDRSGRARVADFGLARLLGPVIGNRGAEVGASGRHTLRTDSDGGVVGTLGHVDADIVRGVPADARADQFAFAVALAKALAGCHPFGDPMDPAYPNRLAAGRLDQTWERRVRGRVPRRVGLALRRALRPAREGRFAGMPQLLSQLDQRRQSWGVLAPAGWIAAAAGLTWLVTAPAPRRCRDGHRHLRGVWDAARRTALADAIGGSGQPNAAQTWTRFEHGVDDYTKRWLAAHREACERGEYGEPDGVFDLRMACVSRRLTELDETLRVFADPHPAHVHHAVHAVSGLLDPIDCASVEEPALFRARPAPQELTRALARAKALARASHLEDALQVVQESLAVLRTTEPHPIGVEFELVAGYIHTDRSDFTAADAQFRSAAWQAVAHGHYELAVRALVGVIKVLAVTGRGADAANLVVAATALLQRVPSPGAAQRDLLGAQSELRLAAGDLVAAEELQRRQLRGAEADLGPDHVYVSYLVLNLGNTVLRRGDRLGARALYERALGVTSQALGSDHPDTGLARSGLGGLLYRQGEFGAAQRELERAHEILLAAYGPSHRHVASAALHLAALHGDAGHPEAAVVLVQSAVAAYRSVFGDEHPRVVEALIARGHVGVMLGRTDAAIRDFEQALAMRLRVLSPDASEIARSYADLGQGHLSAGAHGAAHVALREAVQRFGDNVPADVEANFGGALCGIGRYDEGRAAVERAMETLDDVPSWEGAGLVVAGECALMAGEFAAARASLERALELYAEFGAAPNSGTEARFLLVRALWGLGKRDKARAQARRARQLCPADPYCGATRGAVARWIAEHAPRGG